MVLGYIQNQSRRFYVYVNNRVCHIRESTPEQWHFVTTDQNPADHSSRSVPAAELQNTTCFTGPPFIHGSPDVQPEQHELLDPDNDAEVRPELKTLCTNITKKIFWAQDGGSVFPHGGH